MSEIKFKKKKKKLTKDTLLIYLTEDDFRRLGLVKQTNIPSSNSQVHLPDFLYDKLE